MFLGLVDGVSDFKAVTAAATTAILAYLDAKLHLRKDLRAINGRKMFQDALGQASEDSVLYL